MGTQRICLAVIVIAYTLSAGFPTASWAATNGAKGHIRGVIIDGSTGKPVAWAWARVTHMDPNSGQQCDFNKYPPEGNWLANSGEEPETYSEAGPRDPIRPCLKRRAIRGNADSLTTQNLLTDREGYFITKPLAPGDYWLRVSHVSYCSHEDYAVTVRAGETKVITVKLEPAIFIEQPVTVKAKRAGAAAMPFRRTIDREALANTPGTFEDPLRVLARTPGVETQSDLDGRLSFRGGSPEEAGYSLDGIPIPAAYHFGGVTSIFNPSAIDKITSYASAHPASLGPGTAGYVDIKTSRGPKRERSRRFEVSPITMGFLWGRESEDKHLSAFASLRRTYHDIVLKIMGSEKGTTVPNFFDGEFRSCFKPSETHEISLSILRSGDRVSMGIDGMASAASTNVITVTGDLSRISLGWEARSRRGALGGGASLTYQPYEYDMRIQGADKESMDWDSKSILLSGHLYLLSGNHRMEVGALVVEQKLRYSVSLARGFWKLWTGPLTEGSLEGDPVTLSSRGMQNTGYRAVYAQEKWTPLTERFAVTAGLRAESFAASNEEFLSPRIYLRYNFGSSEAHIAWGIYRGHPLDKPGNPSGVGEGVSSLRAEHLVLGYAKETGSLGTFALDVYGRRTRNVISETAPGVFASTGLSKAYGVDVEWQRKACRWETSASYSFGRSFQLDPSGPLLRTVEQDQSGNYSIAWYHGPKGWYPDNFDLGHSINLSAGLKLGSQTRLSLTWAYRSGRRITPIIDVVHSGDGRAYGIEGVNGGARLRSFHKLDLRFSKRFRAHWGIMETYIDIANLYNRTNLFESVYNRNYTRRKEYRTLPFIPTLGLAIEF